MVQPIKWMDANLCRSLQRYRGACGNLKSEVAKALPHGTEVRFTKLPHITGQVCTDDSGGPPDRVTVHVGECMYMACNIECLEIIV